MCHTEWPESQRAFLWYCCLRLLRALVMNQRNEQNSRAGRSVSRGTTSAGCAARGSAGFGIKCGKPESNAFLRTTQMTLDHDRRHSLVSLWAGHLQASGGETSMLQTRRGSFCMHATKLPVTSMLCKITQVFLKFPGDIETQIMRKNCKL